MIETKTLTAEEQIRTYAFLKVIFVTEPSLEFLKYFQSSEVIDSLKLIGEGLNINDFESVSLTSLIEDYTQLFIGPQKHIALNESIYTEKTPQFWGESTVEVKQFIYSIGLEIESDWKQMPDHISVEFEVMQKLLEAKLEAIKNNNELFVKQCTSAIEYFYNEHIMKWVPQVYNQIIAKAQTPVYKAVGLWMKEVF